MFFASDFLELKLYMTSSFSTHFRAWEHTVILNVWLANTSSFKTIRVLYHKMREKLLCKSGLFKLPFKSLGE